MYGGQRIIYGNPFFLLLCGSHELDPQVWWQMALHAINLDCQFDGPDKRANCACGLVVIYGDFTVLEERDSCHLSPM